MFLQLQRLNLVARDVVGAVPPASPKDDSQGSFIAHIDRAIEDLRAQRRLLAPTLGRLTQWRERIDRRLRTDRIEFIDRPEYGDKRRVGEIRALDFYNRLLLNYRRMEAVLVRDLLAIAEEKGQPVRLLELASGHGSFAIYLAARAKARGWPIEVTGSDIQPSYVEIANRSAKKAAAPVSFIEVNAFELEFETGAYDLAFIAQSVHHLTPGQLGRMVQQTCLRCPHGLVAIDGRRSLLVLGLLAVSWAPLLNPYWWHDAVVTARRFYSEPELALIAELAAPDRDVDVYRQEPGYSILRVR